MASSYENTGAYDEAERMVKSILESNPDDEWGKLATVGLAEIKDQQASAKK